MDKLIRDHLHENDNHKGDSIWLAGLKFKYPKVDKDWTTHIARAQSPVALTPPLGLEASTWWPQLMEPSSIFSRNEGLVLI